MVSPCARGGGDTTTFGILQDIAQVGALGADAEVVQHHIALAVVELGGLALGLERLLDGVEVLATGGTLRKQRR
jgi:hypothetical protein